MKIIIPMAGTGERFLAKGYKQPKPLIEIEGKPMIGHVAGMFSKDDDFIFVCLDEHLKNTNMRKVLEKISKNQRIIDISSHKLGPVQTCTHAFPYINDDEPVIVNYCDFSTDWDYGEFRREVAKSKCDGCITAYKGFHPHSLGNTMYAYLKLDERGLVKEIREKESFTKNRMGEYASAGTYYFSRGEYLKKYFSQQLERKIQKNGEYYASLAYNLMIADGLKIEVYPLRHFLQWGTPEDLEEYFSWSDYFLGMRAKPKPGKIFNQTNLMPAAGLGKRFSDAGYPLPKPLIPVDGQPMIVSAAGSYPQGKSWAFVCQKEHLEKGLQGALQKAFPTCNILPLSSLTRGQAETCLLAEGKIPEDLPLLIASCDGKVALDEKKYANLASNPEVDALIFTFRGSPACQRNPEMYGWVETGRGNRAIRVSCKKPISENPRKDHAIVGSFWFARASLFFNAAKSLIAKDRRINNEFYVDEAMNELIESGKKVFVFEVEKNISLGTPNELKTYEYWANYFEKKKGK